MLHIVLVYLAGLYLTQVENKKKLILILTLLWLIGNLCFFKYSELFINAILGSGLRLSWMPKVTLPSLLLPLGMSYIIFRLIHFVVEVYKRKSPKCSFIDFGLYVLFFPTFLAGPVERFKPFHTQTMELKAPDLSSINQGLFRILLGILKKFVIADTLAGKGFAKEMIQLIAAKQFVVADNLSGGIIHALQIPESYPRFLVLLFVYGTAIQIYLDFSGYTDMALGVSRLFGYKIMENFNRPFFQRNIALFWRNWHISVYSWIRDYFFFPFFGYRASTLKIYIGIFMTMIVFMLWHKGNLNFLLLGIYNGLGLVIWQLYQEVKRKYPTLRKWSLQPYVKPIAIFFTFNFVSVSFLFFHLDLSQIYAVVNRIF
ncbi:MAG: MBOAT family protein [Syntrophaceae bacterium]|nr:MBOAT family protein [Syntrophaceae bacterium]